LVFREKCEGWIAARALRLAGEQVVEDRVAFTIRLLAELATDLGTIRSKLIALASLSSFGPIVGICSAAAAARRAGVTPRRLGELQERWRAALGLPAGFEDWPMVGEGPAPVEPSEDEDPLGELAEATGLSAGAAWLVYDYFEAEAKQRAERLLWNGRLFVMRRVVAQMLAVGGNEHVQFCAMLLASGMGHVIGVNSQVQAAALCRVTRADMSYFVTAWKERLPLSDTTYSRAEETSQRCRDARLRVVRAGGR
jgi:hypothetical protein